MEEIKVNDYIRTKDGIIGKVIQKEHNIINDEDFYRIQVSSDYTTLVTLEKLYKHSSNIIDLIEIRDLVEIITGYYYDDGKESINTDIYEVVATDVKDSKHKKTNEIGVMIDGECVFIKPEDIKTILTYEQYEAGCYRLED